MSRVAARHLVLIGSMGSGKTTVGRRCAAHLGRRFIDTDELVVELSGRSVPQLFAEGEPEFRAWERRAVAAAAADPAPAVIACGGGAVIDPENRRVLRHSGTVVWLRVTPETAAGRVGDDPGRPLLAGDALGTLRRLGAERAAAYADAATVTVDASGPADEVARAVLAIVGADAGGPDGHA